MAALFTPEEYLEIELQTEYKNEYLNGQVFARLGSTMAHSSISTNLLWCVGSQLRGSSWQFHGGGLRLRTPDASMYAYPDITIFQGKPAIDPYKTTDSLTNPVALLEVVCPATSLFDRCERIRKYRSLETLQEYVLVSVDRVFVECFVREPSREWLGSSLDRLEGALALASAPVTLKLADVYEHVFPARRWVSQ
jgi:Uma2 family endonuclease